MCYLITILPQHSWNMYIIETLHHWYLVFSGKCRRREKCNHKQFYTNAFSKHLYITYIEYCNYYRLKLPILVMVSLAFLSTLCSRCVIVSEICLLAMCGLRRHFLARYHYRGKQFSLKKGQTFYLDNIKVEFEAGSYAIGYHSRFQNYDSIQCAVQRCDSDHRRAFVYMLTADSSSIAFDIYPPPLMIQSTLEFSPLPPSITGIKVVRLHSSQYAATAHWLISLASVVSELGTFLDHGPTLTSVVSIYICNTLGATFIFNLYKTCLKHLSS